MEIYTLDTIIVLTYFLIIICMPIKTILFQKQTVQSMVTGNSTQSPFKLGLSLSATYISSIAILAYVNKSYTGNLIPSAMTWSVPLVTFFSIRYFGPMFFKQKHFSAYSSLNETFGKWSSIYSAIWFILAQIGWVSIILTTMIKLLEPLLNNQLLGLILIAVTCTSLHIYFGGLKNIIKTDVIQWFLLFSFLIITLIDINYNIPKDYLIYELSNNITFGSLALDFSQPSIYIFFLMGIILNLEKFGSDQSFSQRCIALSSESQIKKFSWASTISFFVLVILLIFVGLSLMILSHYTGNDFTENKIPILTNFILRNTTSGMTGLFIVAVLSAAMSSLDSGINSTSIVFLENIYQSIFPKTKQTIQLKVVNTTAVLFSILITLVAYILNTTELDLGYFWLEIESILGGSILGLFILKIINPKTHKISGIFGVLATNLVSSWIAFGEKLTHYSPIFTSPFSHHMALPIGCLSCILVGICTNYFLKKSYD